MIHADAQWNKILLSQAQIILLIYTYFQRRIETRRTILNENNLRMLKGQ